MTDENSLYSDPKQPDEFRTESPLRAFAEYTEHQGWMIAKGFRPSMQHLVRYLAAMERREGYRLVQILEAPTGVPTMIFRTTARAPLDVVSDVFKASELARDWTGHPVRDIDPEKEKRAQELFDRNFGKSNATFSGPLDVSGHRPEIADYETDDEGKPWKLHVTFKGERATFFADFFRGDRREPTDHSSHYVVEWFDNVTQTVHRQPVAEWPEWAQKLVNALPYEKAEEIPDVKITLKGLDPETTHWTRAQWNGDPDDAVNRLRRGDKKMRLAHRNFLEREGCDSTQQYWQTASVASMLRLIDFMEMWDEVSLADCISDEELYKAIGRECPEARAACNADPMAAIEHEVTSQSPVDVLETMAEDIADELGIEVDRDSFQVAREHLEEMVPVKFDDANPEHYNGWACGDIGERLSANGYQILKYCWRLGKKDDPCKELGKAIRYCEREIDLMIAEGAKSHNPEMRVMPDLTGIARGGSPDHIKADEEFFLHNRIAKEPDFTKTIAIKLWSGYNLSQLEAIKADIADHKATLDCGHGLAI